MRPHVGAVAAHHEGQVADERDAVELASGLFPLPLGDPLMPAHLQHRVGTLRTRLDQRLGVVRRQMRRPLPPRTGVVLVVQHTEERVVVEPPVLVGHVVAEFGRPRRVVCPLGRAEVLEGPVQLRVLDGHRRRVLHHRRGIERSAPRVLTRRSGATSLPSAERLHLRHVVQRDVERVDGHGAERRVRRGLARRHVVDGQHLQQTETGGPQPGAESREVGDVADAPAVRRARREQREQETGAAAE